LRVLLASFNPTHDFLPAPPIGLSYVASATAGAGHDVRGLDRLGSARPIDDVRRAVRDLARGRGLLGAHHRQPSSASA